MLILFDHGTPAPLIPFLTKHRVTKARDAGWDQLTNGELLNAAEAAGFDLLVTTDKNMRYQQNLSGRVISVLVLGNSQWRIAVSYVEAIAAAVDDADLEAMPKLTSLLLPRSRLRVPEPTPQSLRSSARLPRLVSMSSSSNLSPAIRGTNLLAQTVRRSRRIHAPVQNANPHQINHSALAPP